MFVTKDIIKMFWKISCLPVICNTDPTGPQIALNNCPRHKMINAVEPLINSGPNIDKIRSLKVIIRNTAKTEITVFIKVAYLINFLKPRSSPEWYANDSFGASIESKAWKVKLVMTAIFNVTPYMPTSEL